MDHGQPEYVAPEIVNAEGATFASDLWSVGIITYLLLSGISPFRGQVSNTILWQISCHVKDMMLCAW